MIHKSPQQTKYIQGGCWYTRSANFSVRMVRDDCGSGFRDLILGFRTFRNSREPLRAP